MNAQLEGNLQLGAHAICAGDKHGLGKFFQIESKQPAESADLREHMLVECLARQHLDPLLGAVARGDVNPGIGVGGAGLRSGLRICALCVEHSIMHGVGRLVCKGMVCDGLICEGRGGRIGRHFSHSSSLFSCKPTCDKPACSVPACDAHLWSGRANGLGRCRLQSRTSPRKVAKHQSISRA